MADDDLVVNRSLRIPRAEIVERFDTSGGPGGQHANKVATRVEVTFDALGSPSLSRWQRDRIVAKCGPVVRVSVDETRSQARNRELAAQRLAERLAASLVVEKKRRATRPTKGSKRRRLEAKKRRSDIKSTRRKPSSDW
ncbi:MAG TPA: alternative ribosome rescue aminoacyl-tRNA hydrolase ArfB [Acidimicrobiales bacterium]|nr:alternative ribosome rescue aminoacyl-tRNA hydrolase ArfB [Acidimicrobiales bacterium]